VNTSEPFTLQIFNTTGSAVWVKSAVASGTKTVDISATALAPGVYHLVLTDGQGGRTVKKFVKE
jgi:hypothetical protein